MPIIFSIGMFIWMNTSISMSNPIFWSTGFALKCQQCSNEDSNFKCSSINDNGNEVECKAGEDYCVYVTYTDGKFTIEK